MSRNEIQTRPADENFVMKRSLITGKVIRCASSQKVEIRTTPKTASVQFLPNGNGVGPVLSLKPGYDEIERTKEGAIRVFLKFLERNRQASESMEKSLVCHLANIKSRNS